MKNNLRSLNLLSKLSAKYKYDNSNLNIKFNQYLELLVNEKKKISFFQSLIKYTFFIFHLIYIISPLHNFILYCFYHLISKSKKIEVVLSINKSVNNRWSNFIQFDSVKHFYIDSLGVQIFANRLPYKYVSYVIYNYIFLYLLFIFSPRRKNHSYDLALFKNFLSQFMHGAFLGGFKSSTTLDGAAYTLNLPKYLGIKSFSNETQVAALQIHSASSEPMMSLFQADKVLSIISGSSQHLPQVFGKRIEKVVGSRLLVKSLHSLDNISFRPNQKSFLILLGNTLHPNGIYYGVNHNQSYSRYLKDLVELPRRFPTWEFYYLHHRNYSSDFEIKIFNNSSIIPIDPFSDVYLTSLKNYFVISYSSTVITELSNYHPNAYLYSPDMDSPFRVIGDEYKIISSFSDLIFILNNLNDISLDNISDNLSSQIINPKEFELRLLNASII
tara:strand:+ start:1877 stop:3202 length:1326 start_codon:yes stop_codon:yes gene_type:complete